MPFFGGPGRLIVFRRHSAPANRTVEQVDHVVRHCTGSRLLFAKDFIQQSQVIESGKIRLRSAEETFFKRLLGGLEQ